MALEHRKFAIRNRKNVLRRAFHGLPGSPLATTVEKQPAEERSRALRAERASNRTAVKALLRLPLSQRIAAVEQKKCADKQTRAAKALAEKEAKMRLKLTEEGMRRSEKESDRILEKRLWKNATEAAKADRMPLVSDGAYLTDAPTGKGRLVSGGYSSEKIATVADIAERNHGGVLPLHGEGRQGKVRAQGVGQGPGGRNDRSETVIGVLSDVGDENFTTPAASSRFEAYTDRSQSKFGDSVEKRSVLACLIGRFDDSQLDSSIFDIVPDSDVFRCRQCGFETDWWKHAREHFENAVEDELLAFETATKKAKKIRDAWDELLESSPTSFVMPIKTADETTVGRHASIFISERNAHRRRLRKVDERAKVLLAKEKAEAKGRASEMAPKGGEQAAPQFK